MKKKAELAAAALALMFLFFSIGYYAGRRSAPSAVSLSSAVVLTSEEKTPEPPENASAHFEPSAVPSTNPPAPPETPAAETSPSTPMQKPSGTSAAETPAAAPPSVPSEAQTMDSHYNAEGLLRINVATQTELETLPGIGPALAIRIIEYRDTNGGFKRLTTLKSVSGIGDKRYDAIKDLITVD